MPSKTYLALINNGSVTVIDQFDITKESSLQITNHVWRDKSNGSMQHHREFLIAVNEVENNLQFEEIKIKFKYAGE